ncbi:MAG: hypothetical protein IPK75_20325 [Acidobacteria bacterium]|nr:hypothetical protein [Acidobacteriota bacterium]
MNTCPRFPPDRFERACIYLYRIWPRINRKQADPTAYNYIDKYGVPFTPDEVKQRWGEGKYQALMLNLDKRTDNQIAGCVFTVDDPNCPPVLNLAELVLGAPANSSYEESLRNRNMHPSQSIPGQAPAAADASASVALANLATEAIRQGNRQTPAAAMEQTALNHYAAILQTAMTQNAKASGGLDFTGLAAIITAIIPLIRPATPVGPDPRDALINMLMDKLLNAPQHVAVAPAGSLTETLAAVKSIMEVSHTLNPNAGAPESISTILANNAAPILGEIRGVVQGIASMVGARNAAANGQASQPGQPQQQQPQQQQVEGAGQNMDLMQMALNTIEPVLIKQFREGNEGWALGEWIENGWGADSYNRIANIGKEQIIAALLARPNLRQLFDGLQPQMDAYVTSFLEWPKRKAEFEAQADENAGAPGAAPEEGAQP